MKFIWSRQALHDLVRLHDFLAPKSQQAAAKLVDGLSLAPERISRNPRIRERILRFCGRDVREILIGKYELRYELLESTLVILRIFHTREKR